MRDLSVNKGTDVSAVDGFLPFTNDFIFRMVMRNPKVCMDFLKTVLPDEDFSEIKMKLPANPLLREEPLDDEDFDMEKVRVEIQKSLKFEGGMHGVRFDAYAETPEKAAEIEMQAVKKPSIGKRTRFYQCNMDLDHFEKGNDYSELKRSFIIMICTFDPFGLDEPVYYFQTIDKNLDLNIGDGAFKIILNTACNPDKVPEGLHPLYAYINDPSKCEGSALVEAIDARVKKFNGRDWRWRQVTLEYMMWEEYRKGATEATERLNKLNDLLLQAERFEDLKRSTKDSDFQQKLLEEFGL